MKKFILGFVMVIASALSVNGQSIEFHQSYTSEDYNAPYCGTRIIVSNFWTSKNGKMNLFTWNSFDKDATNTLLYTEHKIGSSNFYIHPEVRFDYMYGFVNARNYYFKPQLGISYLIPWDNGVAIYLTPKITTTYNNWGNWSKPDLQFSINTSYESSKFYYEGYIDTNWFGYIKRIGSVKKSSAFGLFAEQKGYYKMTDHFSVGASVVASLGKLSVSHKGNFIQPYFSMKVSL